MLCAMDAIEHQFVLRQSAGTSRPPRAYAASVRTNLRSASGGGSSEGFSVCSSTSCCAPARLKRYSPGILPARMADSGTSASNPSAVKSCRQEVLQRRAPADQDPHNFAPRVAIGQKRNDGALHQKSFDACLPECVENAKEFRGHAQGEKVLRPHAAQELFQASAGIPP